MSDKSAALDSLPIKLHHIPITRNPLTFSNIKALKSIMDIIENNDIDYVHCHSPSGGLVGRLASYLSGVKKVIYTAHGFHFYKGAPLKNWLVYYPVEFLLSYITDAIFTINKEDFQLASNKMNAKRTYFLEGIGIDLNNFIEKDTNCLNECSNSKRKIVITTIGEFIDRKNYSTALLAISKLKGVDYHYNICGVGEKFEEMTNYANELGISDNVSFLGYRKDIPAILNSTDIFLFTSYQEGLPVSIMEAMACGLPVVCSKIRGNVDLIDRDQGGILCNPNSPEEFSNAITKLAISDSLRNSYGMYNRKKIYSYSNIELGKKVNSIYTEIFDE